ncbi:putative choline transport protein [Lophiostoma macrostomum CBS 122681]|uniref:Putative choline transport protein n=1 Tax=Lophiostoma macrostomum CBS 122681 TaxID=1314788 RepID=A0A6A6SIC2_9PLEO|nr:putative choline transport protein [Lophiostoma macrostomum CBS 122681]
MHALGVAFTPAGALFGMIQLFATCGAMTHPEWVPQRWQLVVGYEGANILMLLLLLYAGKHLALLNRISLVGIFGGLFIVVGCLLGGSGAGSSHQFVWTKFQNDSGFASNVYCSLIALGTSLYAYGVPHWLCNLADDVERPDRAIPIALAAQQIGNGVTLFLFFVAAGYAVTDFDALLETLYPSSVGVIFDQAVQSKGGSIALILIICIPGIISFMSYNSACIYVFHGFVRTGAIPGWQWLIKIGKQGKGAANIIYVLTFINAILGLIYLGSPVGFSILLSVPGALYFSGFLVPLGAHVITSGRNLKRHGWFSLPRKVSVALAAVNILGVTFHLILVCLPREGPVTTENMNHSVLFMVFGLICALASWNFYGKRHYRGISIEVIDGLSLGRAGVSNESAKTAQDALAHTCQHGNPK